MGKLQGHLCLALTLLAVTALPIQAGSSQTIAFDAVHSQILGISPFPLIAQASSGLPVTFVSNVPAVCKNSGSLVMLLSVGTCSITASQPGNGTFNAATPVTQVFTVTAAKVSGSFMTAAASPFAVGTSPDYIAAGDFNGDGIPDFAITGVLKTSNLTVLLGNGSGGFSAAPGSPFTVGTNPTSVVTGDFNGDGIQDLATANHGIYGSTGVSNLTILLGNGSGGFTAAPGSPVAISAAIGSGSFFMAVGDFNGDGIQDLVVNDVGGNSVEVFLGNGVGGFTAAAGSPFLVGFGPSDVAVGDFNGDGIQDIAVSGDNSVAILLGNGSAGFTAATGSPFAVGTQPDAVVVGDFNGDGIQDLATVNSVSANVTVLLGDGSGGFTAASGSPFSLGSNALNPVDIAVGDFNGDGIQDLVTTNNNSANVTILLGNGTGGFALAAAGPFAVGKGPGSVAVADFNADGNTDLAVTNGGGASVTVLLGLVVGHTSQTITFGALSNATFGASPFTISATSSSALAVSFATASSSVCTVAGDTVTIVGGGTCSIIASQAGNATYAAAATVMQSFTVIKASQTISFGTLSNVASGVAPFSVSATATSSLAVTFASTTTAVCTVAGSVVTVVGTGACTITASQAGNTNYLAAASVGQSFNVAASNVPTCNSATANPVFVRAEGTTEQVADTTISCTGGNGSPMNLTVYLSPAVTITSATLGSGGSARNEALAGLNATSTTFAAGAVNGTVSGNSVTFSNVPTAVGTFAVTITNIKINASTVAISGSVPTAVAETIFVSGSGVTPAVLTAAAVAYVTNGLANVTATSIASDQICNAITAANPAFNVQFSEGFATAFRVQGSAAANTTLGSWFTNGTETGYGVTAPTVNTATSGTRIKIIFNNIPANVSMYVPLTASNSGGTVALTASETGAFSAVAASNAAGAPSGSAAVVVSGGSGTVIYEVTTSAPAALETYTVPVYLVAAAGTLASPASAITATVSFAPIGTSANVPNFVNGTSTTTVNGSPFVACGSGTPQTISFGALSNVAFGASSFSVSATSSSGLPVSFSSNTPGVCTVAGNTVSIVGGGTCLISASQSGNGTYAAAATVTQSFTVTPLSQTITFGVLSNQNLGVSPFTVGATASSGLAVTFASASTSVCTVSGSTVTVIAAGTCTIVASQPGNANYIAATAVTQSFTVTNNTGQASCSSATANAIFIRAEGKTEQVADLTISCAGGNGSPANITVTMSPSVPITSATLGTGPSAESEALAGLNATSTTLAAGAINGVVSGNSVTFTGVPTAVGAFTLTVTNIKVNASVVAVSNGVPPAVDESVSLGGAGIFPTVLGANAGITVAYITNGLSGVKASGSTANALCNAITAFTGANFSVQFSESFASAFKTQGSSASNTTLGSWDVNNTETGYGVSANSTTNTATTGTRVMVTFNNVPTNVTLYIPTSITNNGATMTLTQSATGPFVPVAGSIANGAPGASASNQPGTGIAAALTVSSGSATAIYEETVNNPNAVESYTIPVYLSAPAGVLSAPSSAITATVSFAPIGAASNVPTFVSGSSTATVNGSSFVATCTPTLTFGSPITATPPDGTVGAYYATALSATGSTAPYSNWTVSSGSLPAGLSLNASTGVISGIPTTAVGSPFVFGVTVQNSVGTTSAAATLKIVIVPAATVPEQTEVLPSSRSATLQPLLVPYVITQAGFDTEITISNTSLDTLGSTATPGTCQVNYYGTGAIAGQTSASIAAGQQLVFNVSQGGSGIAAAPGFSGYVIANCSFPLARGSARVFVAGTLAWSEDAQLLSLPRSVPATGNILIPYAAAEFGFDTGIVIANTSSDPFGSNGATATSGTCTLDLYSVGFSAPTVFTTPTIAAGTVYTLLLSSIAPASFSGYVIAQCNFGAASAFAYLNYQGFTPSSFNTSITTEVIGLPRSRDTQPLLFSSVTNQNGSETGIVVANTSSDPFGASGATAESGTCTFNFYGTTAPAAFTTATILPGSVYAATLSSIAGSSFSGYVTATCNFAPARGFAYIIGPNFTTLNYVGVNTYSEIPEVVNLPRNTAPSSLLFSSTTNQNAEDTGIVISNTSKDSFKTTTGAGTCTLNYFGSNAPAPQTSSSIAAGSQLAFTLSQGNAGQGIAGAPGFRGYIIAGCGFPLARGVAAIQGSPGGLVVTTASLPGGTAGASYSQTLKAGNGVTPYKNWTVASGSLPNGLSLNASTGVISGTPTTAAGSPFNFGISVADSGGNVSVAKSLSIAVAAPTPTVSGITNGFDFTSPPLAPGSLASLFGANLASSTAVASGAPAPFTLGAGTSVTVNGTPAALLFVSPAQVNFQIPFETATGTGTASVAVTNVGSASTPFQFAVAPAAPGILASDILNPNSSVNASGNPAAVGAVASVFLTGGGAVSPAVGDGAAGLSSPLSNIVAPVTATVGGVAATVGFAGLAPGLVGYDQVNITIPSGLATGSYPLVISVNGQASKSATVYVGGGFTITSPSNLGTYPTGVIQIPLQATGGTGALTWSISSGSLPAGLALRTDGPTFFPNGTSAGIIGVAATSDGGTPYSFTIKVTDSASNSVTLPVTLHIVSENFKDLNNLPDAVFNQSYSYTFTVLNGTSPAVSLVSPPSCLAGLSLTGLTLSGIPTVASTQNNSCNFQLQISDGGTIISENFNLRVADVAITTAGILPNATQNTAYNGGNGVTLSATGGTGGYAYQINNGGLPQGLSLSTGGLISGTVNSFAGFGRYAFSVQVTDSSSNSYQQNFSMDVLATVPQLPSLQVGTIDDLTVGVPGSFTMAASGGVAPYVWNVTGLPAGMSFRSGVGTSSNVTPGDVEIWGVPQATGSYSVKLTATDSSGIAVNTTVTFSVSALAYGFQGPFSNILGTVNTAISPAYQLRVIGGTSSYMSVISGGTPPPGASGSLITFNGSASGVNVTGTPVTNGNFNFQLTFRDSATPTSQTLAKTLNLTVNPTTVQIFTNNNLGIYPTGGSNTVNITFNACCAQSGSLNWSVPATVGGNSNTLPPGLSLSASTGQLTGAVATSALYIFYVEATDGSANIGIKRFFITFSPISITTSAVNYGNVGTAYTPVQFAATGLQGTPVTWAFFGGLLPPGMSISSPGGVLSGTPTSPGQYNFTVFVGDGAGNSATRGYSLSIYPVNSAPPVAISNGSSLGTYMKGDLEADLFASGGNGTYTWSLQNGSALPPGLSLRTDPQFTNGSSQAAIIGVATTVGSYSFTLVASSAGQQASQAFTMKITALNLADPFSLPDAYGGLAYNYTMTPVNASASPTFTYSFASGNNPPAWLNINSSTGALSGNPAAPFNQYNFGITVSDGTDTVTRFFNLSTHAIHITCATPACPNGQMPNATQGQSSYSLTLGSTDSASGTVTFTVNNLPNGLTIQNGVIAGTVNSSASAGLQAISVTATDGTNTTTQQFSLVVNATTALMPRLNFSAVGDPVVGQPYSSSISVCCGGIGPSFTWSATGLPAGLFFRYARSGTAGIASGTPSTNTTPGFVEIYGVAQTAGDNTITLTVSDSTAPTAQSTQLTFNLHVSPLDQTVGVPNGTIGATYATSLREVGGTPTPGYTVSLISGALPAGISLVPETINGITTAMLSGTPAESGSFNFKLHFVDSAGTPNTLDRYFNFNIANSTATNLQISTASPLQPLVAGNSSVNIGLAACCTASPYTWSVVSGSLPSGLTLGASTGQITGTASPAGNYTFLVQVQDAATHTARKQFTLQISSLQITTASLPFGNVGSPYNGASGLTLTASGGATPYTWSLQPNTFLPPGLTFTGGVISGTPTSAGQYFPTFVVTDSASPANSTSLSLTLNVYTAGGAPPLSLSTNASFTWSVGVQSIQLSATGGIPPYTYSLSPSATPVPGCRVQTGAPLPTNFGSTVTGGFLCVVTTPNVYNTSIRVTDSSSTPNTFDRAVTIKVVPLMIGMQGTLPKGTVGSSYTFNPTATGGVAATGGTGTYTFSATNLPPGLSINSGTAAITGTPTSAGTFSATITLGNTSVSGTVTFTETIVINPFAITNATILPEGMAGSTYSQTLTAPGCGTGCTWTVSSGTLPTSFLLTTSSGDGLLSSGTNTASTFDGSFTIQASGSNGTTQEIFSLIIAPNTITALSVTTNITSTSQLGTSTASIGLLAAGGTPPYTFSLQAGSLPPGITVQSPGDQFGGNLAPGTQYLAGRPSVAGTYNFTIQVADSTPGTALTATRNLTWTISSLSVQYLTLPLSGTTLTVNQATTYTQPILVVGGSGIYTSWTNPVPTQQLQPGLTLNAGTGVISGIPTNSGNLSIPFLISDNTSPTANFVDSNISINVASGAGGTVTLGGPAYGTVVPLGSTQTYNITPSGGTGPYTVSAVGSLPPGVLLESGSTLGSSFGSGAYGMQTLFSTPGTYTFTIQAVDSSTPSLTGERTYSLIVPGYGPLVTNTTLPQGSVSTSYSQQLYSFDNTTAVSWALSSGSAMPPGLSVSAAGLISGIPTTAGTYSFALTFNDGNGSSNNTFTLKISPVAMTTVTATPGVLPLASIGVPYGPTGAGVTLTASGGSGAITWTLLSGSLPDGLALSSSTGVISGTPTGNTGTGLFVITLAATNNGGSTSKQYSIFVGQTNPAILDYAIYEAALPDAILGQNYVYSLVPDGGVPGYTWAVASGSTLPPGFSLVPASSVSGAGPGIIAIAGIPATAGQYTFNLVLTDSTGASNSLTRTFTLRVSPISITNSNPPTARQGTPYSFQFEATGGTGPYTYSLITNPNNSFGQDALPFGLSMNSSGLISGTPTGTGAFNFLLTVTDSAAHTFSKALSLTSENSFNAQITLTNGNFPVNLYITKQLAVSGSASTFTWSIQPVTPTPSAPIIAGLPTGITLQNNGLLAGTASTPGIYQFAIQAVDNSNASDVVLKTITIKVTPISLTAPVYDGLFSGSFPAATVGSPYSFTLVAAGGLPPYTFTEAPTYPLPPGMNLGSTGVISGTPTQSGKFTIRPVITDANGSQAFYALIDLIVTTNGKPVLNPRLKANGSDTSVGVPFALPLDRFIDGGVAPFTWTVANGSTLPPGVSILAGSPAGLSNVLAGTPTTVGVYNFTLNVADSSGQTLAVPAQGFNVSALAATPASIPNAVRGTAYSTPLSVTGGTPPYSFQYAAGLTPPPGVSISNGSLSGTPTYAGVFPIGVIVTDSAATPNSLTYYYDFSVDDAAGEVPSIAVTPNPVSIVFHQGSTTTSTALAIGSSSGNLPFGATLYGLAGASLSATAGITNGGVNLNYGSLAIGTYTGFVGVSAASSVNAFETLPVSITVTASLTAQTITFGPLANQVLGSIPPTLSATSTSGLAVAFASNSASVCTVFGSAITLVATGTCSITASQPGNGTYAAATPVTQTFTVAAAVATPPTADSVTPNSGTGATQTFTFKYSSVNGYSYLDLVFGQIATSTAGSNSCYFQYNIPGATLYLYDNSGSNVAGTIALGSTATASNGQCTISGTGLTVTGSGNQLSLTVPVTLNSSYTGAMNLYGFAYDHGGQVSGWQTLGTWAISASPLPTADSVSPASGSGSSQTFTFKFSSPSGYTDLQSVFGIIGPDTGGVSECYFQYYQPGNVLILNNDAGNGYAGTAAPGSSTTIGNSQCSISGFTVSGSGNQLTLTVPVTFTAGFAGAQNVYGFAFDQQARISGWQPLGTFTAVASTLPTADSVTPSSGTGGPQTFTFKFSSPAGYANLQSVFGIIGPNTGGVSECYFQYYGPGNVLILNNDAGNGYAGVAPAGSSSAIGNSQCSISDFTVTGTGNQLTLTVPVTFTASFTGSQNVYGFALDQAGKYSGWQPLGIWTPTAVVSTLPTADSVTPSSGTGGPQTFVFKFSSPAGYANLQSVFGIIGPNTGGVAECYFQYYQPGNVLILNNDAGNGYAGVAPAGSSSAIGNSQCSISDFTVTGSGKQLTLTVPVTFTASFTGSKNVYGFALDQSSQYSGWQPLGTWTPTAVASTLPTADSVTPSSGTGGPQTFTFKFSSPAGYTNLQSVFGIIGPNTGGVAECYFQYYQPGNVLILNNDAGNGYAGTAPVGSSSTISNSQCSITGFTVSGSGKQLTLTVPVTFTASFTGSKNVYGFALDQSSQFSGWQPLGTWTPTAVASTLPTADSVTPASGTGGPQTFTFKFSSPAGYTNLQSVYGIIGPNTGGVSECYFQYYQPNNILILNNDGGNGYAGAATPGSSSAISNSQCSISGFTVSGSGNQLTLTVPVTFTGTFTGSKNVYGFALDQEGQYSGWQALGTWTPTTTLPTADSVSPASGTGLSQTFTFRFSSPSGYGNLQSVFGIIGPNTGGVSECYFQYYQPNNILILNNDGGNGYAGAATPGSSSAISNSQCSITGFTVSGSGNQLTLTVPVTFTGALTGSQNVYGFALDQAGKYSGWQPLGDWTP